MVKPSIRKLMNKIVRTKTRVSIRQTALYKPLTAVPQKNNVLFNRETVEPILTQVKSKAYKDPFYSPTVPISQYPCRQSSN